MFKKINLSKKQKWFGSIILIIFIYKLIPNALFVKHYTFSMYLKDDNSLLGPDQNDNGIRDDIELWIDNHPLVLNDDIKKAMYQSARVQRDSLKFFDDKEKSIQVNHRSNAASSCEGLVFRKIDPTDTTRLEIVLPLVKLSYNTKSRKEAYDKYTNHLTGKIWAMPDTIDDSCDFKTSEKY